jgi:hypothetical protein
MSVSLALPPSGRDFLAYQRIVVDAASTRTVAEELKISQTRVRQIVRRFIDWLQSALPPDAEVTEAYQLRVGRYIAADRLERYYIQANRLWEQTGQAKYLSAILRILNAQTKIPAMSGTIEALAMDAIIGPLPDEEVQSPKPQVQSAVNRLRPETPSASATLDTGPRTLDLGPPPRDCSPKTASRPVAAESVPQSAAVSPSLSISSDEVRGGQATARRTFFAPAQCAIKPIGAGLLTAPKPPTAGLALASKPSADVAELKITPETLGVSSTKHTSRRERRRLRRLMASK